MQVIRSKAEKTARLAAIARQTGQTDTTQNTEELRSDKTTDPLNRLAHLLARWEELVSLRQARPTQGQEGARTGFANEQFKPCFEGVMPWGG